MLKPFRNPYRQRLASLNDVDAIAPLWQTFCQDRAAADPTLVLKANFDFETYIHQQLSETHTYAWLLEYHGRNEPQIVGCLIYSLYDEAPAPNTPSHICEQFDLESPFQPRRLATTLGLYVDPEHRKPKAIASLITATIDHAETFGITDIDLLIANDQDGLQTLLDRLGFQTGLQEYLRVSPLTSSTDLPSLHPPRPEAA